MKLRIPSLIKRLGSPDPSTRDLSPGPSNNAGSSISEPDVSSLQIQESQAEPEIAAEQEQNDGDGEEETDRYWSEKDDESPTDDRPDLNRHLSYIEAASIIGGMGIEDDFQSGDTSSIVSSVNEEDLRNGRKVFSFALPFSTPMTVSKLRAHARSASDSNGVVKTSVNKFLSAGESLADTSKNTVMNIGNNLFGRSGEGEEKNNMSINPVNLFKKPAPELPDGPGILNTTNLTLEDLARFDTNQEDILYRGVKQQDNSRLRAVLQTIRARSILPEPEVAFPQIDGDVIIMGGFRGSILRDRITGRRVWIPLKVGFKIRKIDLKVGPADQDEYDMESKIYPDGMMTNIGPIDISKKLMNKLQGQHNCRLHVFSYDWRLSSDINSAKLHKLLKELHSKDKKKKGTIIICHSMGGLIAHHAMQMDPTLVRGMLYAGSPSSCPNILGPFRYGETILFANKVLTTKTTFLMRSCYSFLPLSGECFVDRDDPSKRYDVDFFDVKTWQEFEFSPCVSKDPEVRLSQTNGDTDETPLDYEVALEYLERTLKRTKKFLEELAFDPEKSDIYPPMAVLYGCSIPTLRHAKVQGREGIKEGDYDHLRFGNGDGVIYHKSLMPHCRDDRYQVCAKVPSRMGHISLLTDIEGVGRGLNAILVEEEKRKNTNTKHINKGHGIRKSSTRSSQGTQSTHSTLTVKSETTFSSVDEKRDSALQDTARQLANDDPLKTC